MAKRRPKTAAGTRGEAAHRVATAADERAVAAGMRFDGERAAFACDWIEQYCRLYEGDRAGEPFILLPFQRDFFSRLFGWVRWSDEWGGWVRRFTHAGFWSAKKQGKSPMAAAYNLYLLCGDGEPGQKVYMMAGNSKQARIAQTHAVMMVRQSPALDIDRGGDCKVNNTTMDIIHLPSQSKIEVVTGDDKRSADKKHGYNGSVTIDEMHVVNRDMMKAVGRAGISRREPLQTSFSTAGEDVSSVGAERFEYGRQVNRGDRADLHFLHVEYGAPDGATEADIDAHLEAYGRAANPAWGEMIKPSQFRADWEGVKGRPREVALFMMERLSMWVGSTQRWLDAAGWEAGRREFGPADLAGRRCFLGLDLSRTRDMTAAVFVFPWPEDGPECLRVWPLFWLPADRAAALDHLYPYRSWAAAGALTLIPGAVVSYAAIEADILAAISQYNFVVAGLYYDQTYAEDVTQRLAEAVGIPAGERVAVPQRINWITALAKEFERRVVAGYVHHAGNPVMTWQVGHCEVVTDRNQNIAPQKPKPDSGKSIDGIAATLDAMAGVINNPESGPVVYSSRPMLIL